MLNITAQFKKSFIFGKDNLAQNFCQLAPHLLETCPEDGAFQMLGKILHVGAVLANTEHTL